MDGKEIKKQKVSSSIVNKTFERLEEENIDISFEDVKNLMKYAPNIKEMVSKVTDYSTSSAQNVYEVLKKAISIYGDELKRDNLSQDERERIYDRIDSHAEKSIEQNTRNQKFIGGVLTVAIGALVSGVVKFGPKVIKATSKR